MFMILGTTYVHGKLACTKMILKSYMAICNGF